MSVWHLTINGEPRCVASGVVDAQVRAVVAGCFGVEPFSPPLPISAHAGMLIGCRCNFPEGLWPALATAKALDAILNHERVFFIGIEEGRPFDVQVIRGGCPYFDEHESEEG